jgi:hypothetical protein
MDWKLVRRKTILLLKAVGYGIAVMVGAHALMTGVTAVGLYPDPLVLMGVAGVGSVLVVNLLLGRFLRPPEVWLGWRHSRRAGRFLGGAAAGLLMAGAAVLGLVLSGNATISLRTAPLTYLGQLPPPLLALLPAALWEELVFRGYPLSAVSRAAGRTVAAFAMALLFALAHRAAGPYPLGTVNIFLIGLVLAQLRLGPGGLPAAWGAHFAWNATLLALGAEVSGLELAPEGIAYEAAGARWLTGGGFGPEAGLATTAVAVLAMVLIMRVCGISAEEGRRS